MGAIIGGAAQVVGSAFGGRARRREQKAAVAQQQQDISNVRNFDFSNPYKNLENTAEDLTVNQQAANFQAQQTDQGLAQGLDAFLQSGGGGGGAQTFANAALQAKQGASADIAGQETQNQQIRAQRDAELQNLEAQGEEDLQAQQYQQQGTNLQLSTHRRNAADDARRQATGALTSGLGSIIGGVATGGLGGLLGGAGTKGAGPGGGATKVGGFLQKLGNLG